MTPEGELKTNVIALLNGLLREPEFFLRMNSGKLRVRGGWMQMCPEGTADFVAYLKNQRTVWLELKAGTTKKDRIEKQKEFRDKVLSLGHEYAECWSVADVLNALGERTI